MLTYSSLRDVASLKALSKTDCSAGAIRISAAAPCTLGVFCAAASTDDVIPGISAPNFWKIGVTIPSVCPMRANIRCSTLSSGLWASEAKLCAVWSASCALIVNLSNLIMCLLYCSVLFKSVLYRCSKIYATFLWTLRFDS